ncbi:MAG: class II aldolase/adducin family protein [Actinomycetales bacterium]
MPESGSEVLRADLVRLARYAGQPGLQWACAAEGNVSGRWGSDRMVVKASGCSMERLESADLVDVALGPLLALLDNPGGDDAAVDQAYRSAMADGADASRQDRRPSVEALLHAVVLDRTDASIVLHTHPIAVNRLLCSRAAEQLVAGALFPDQIVMMGQHQLLVPYVDPGLPLARAVRASLDDFAQTYGRMPKVIYLRNHGVFVAARDVQDAIDTTSMTVKVSAVLLGAIAAGGAVYLGAHEGVRIETRPDEQYRRAMSR